jgi:hypothetical protein
MRVKGSDAWRHTFDAKTAPVPERIKRLLLGALLMGRPANGDVF